MPFTFLAPFIFPILVFLLLTTIGFGALWLIEKAKHEADISKQLYFLNEEKAFLKQERFLTESEENFYKEMCDSLSEKYYIFPQVNLRSILKVDIEKGDAYNRLETLEKFIVDYVIFNKSDLSPVLVLEQNDSGHKWFKRYSRDEWVKKALENAGIPFHSFSSNHYIFEHEIKMINSKLENTV